MIRKHYFGTFLSLFIVVCSATLAQAASVKVSWSPNSEADLAGYRLYYQLDNATPTKVETGNTTSFTLENLTPGATYNFYLTAFNTAGLESDPSTTVAYTIPSTGGTSDIRFGTGGVVETSGGTFVLNATAPAGSQFELQATDDLKNPNWVPVATATANQNGVLRIEDKSTGLPQRFYRVRRL